MAKENWMQRNFSKRKLIKKNEGKISYVQIIGFIMIAAGILYMTVYRMVTDTSAEGMAISFFVIMLGMSFSFPSLLEGPDKEVSTMRIVVFMMVNVICLLLIKIGWAADIHSLSQIGLDQYWMGVIAFIFGAKATQSYFESKLAAPPPPKEQNNNSSLPLTGHQNAQLAIDANPDLYTKYPNIVKLIPSYCLDNGERMACIDICIADSNKSNIPAFLEYKDADGTTVKMKTRIIINYGNAKPQVGRGDFICNDNSRAEVGTVCCILDGDRSNDRYLLTCNHVMTGGDFVSPGHLGDRAVEFIFGDDFEDVGTWKSGKMDHTVDAAIIKIDSSVRKHSNDVGTDVYVVSEDDCSHTEVELKGALSKTKKAFIIHINQPIGIDYNHNKTVEVRDLISISRTASDSHFSPVTRKGDSGSLVYHAKTRQPIGMVVGANTQFTFVIPIKTILNSFPELKLKISNH